MTDSCTCCKMAKFPAWQTVKCKWTWNDKIRLYHISCTNKQMHLEGVGNFKTEKIWRYRHRGFWKWLRKEPSNLFFWMATIKELIPKCLETVWWIATTLVYDQAERLLDSEFPCVGGLKKMRRAQVRSLKFSTFGFGWGGKKTLKWSLTVNETHPQHDSWNLLRLEI